MKKIENLSLALFVVSLVLLGVLYLPKITGYVVYSQDPNPLYGISLLIITLISALTYFFIKFKKVI